MLIAKLLWFMQEAWLCYMRQFGDLALLLLPIDPIHCGRIHMHGKQMWTPARGDMGSSFRRINRLILVHLRAINEDGNCIVHGVMASEAYTVLISGSASGSEYIVSKISIVKYELLKSESFTWSTDIKADKIISNRKWIKKKKETVSPHTSYCLHNNPCKWHKERTCG